MNSTPVRNSLVGDKALAHRIMNMKITLKADNDDYVVYPDVDGDEDVVYAYHAINDK